MPSSNYENEAEVLYRSAGFDPDEPAKMLELARRLLGKQNVEGVHARGLGQAHAALVTINGERRIYFRRCLPPVLVRFALAHELAHWALGLDSSTAENEAACDSLAACLIAPRRAFQTALRETGLRYPKLAQWFAATESCMALRVGEVTEAPLALITPKSVRVRGADFGWPSESNLRILARTGPLPGVRKAVLRDDRRRVALRGI